MKAIRDMTGAEFYIFMCGGQRMLRVNALAFARTQKDRGMDPRAYVEAARSHHRAAIGYLREYRKAKKFEALKAIQNALQEARA